MRALFAAPQESAVGARSGCSLRRKSESAFGRKAAVPSACSARLCERVLPLEASIRNAKAGSSVGQLLCVTHYYFGLPFEEKYLSRDANVFFPQQHFGRSEFCPVASKNDR
jgi:hypothetical protein